MSGFGGGGSGGGLFGNANQNNSSQTSNLFGNNATTSETSSATSGTSLFGTTAGNTSSPFSNFGASSRGTNSSLFAASKPASTTNAFTLGGNTNNEGNKNPSQNPFANLSTPSKTFNADASTTPAGPPPANASASLFGETANSKPGGLFGSMQKDSTSSTTPQTSSVPSLFGSTPATSSSNVFGGASTTPSMNLFAQSKDQPNQPSSGLGASTDEVPGSGAVTSHGQSTPSTKPANNLFGAIGSSSQAVQPSSTPSTSAPSTSSNPFANLGGSKDAGTTANQTSSPFASAGPSANNASTTTTSSGPFASASATQKGDTTTSSAQNNQPASTTATTSGPSLFGATAPASNPAPAASAGSAPNVSTRDKTETGTAGGPSLGASTTGQPPNAQSRLKNKSMDDIITRWASDLTKYQKEFQGQAEKVAQWDRQLVDNSNAISKLYSKTFQAERDTAEIQKQLSAVESHQEELSQWLDRYEQEVDNLMSRQINPQDGLQGPDQERERTYRTAEQVSEHLGEMGQDLSSMIEEINSASKAISKTNRPDDPLSQIVRVLNGHLSQLQLIDRGTAELQAKVTAAQRESHRLGARSRNGLGYDAAEDFGRSFRSRG